MENNKNRSDWSIYIMNNNKEIVTWVTINEKFLSRVDVWEKALNRLAMELANVNDSLAGKTFEIKKSGGT